MTTVKLECGVCGNGLVFSITIATNATVSMLQGVIADTMRAIGWSDIDARALALDVTQRMLDDSLEEHLKGVSSNDDQRVVHVLVELITTDAKALKRPRSVDDEQEGREPEVKRATALEDVEGVPVEIPVPDDAPPAKRPRLDNGADTWQLPEWQHPALPLTHEAADLLQEPLAFRLKLKHPDAEGTIFKSDGPVLKWPELKVYIDAFLYNCERPPEMSASLRSWREYYNGLLRIPSTLLLPKNVPVQEQRSFTTRADASSFILHYKGLVLMRGEERRANVPIETAHAALLVKTPNSIPLFYGDLLYIVGYATSGSQLVVETVSDWVHTTELLNVNILQERAKAVRFFCNMAGLLHKMIASATHTGETELNAKRWIR